MPLWVYYTPPSQLETIKELPEEEPLQCTLCPPTPAAAEDMLRSCSDDGGEIQPNEECSAVNRPESPGTPDQPDVEGSKRGAAVPSLLRSLSVRSPPARISRSQTSSSREEQQARHVAALEARLAEEERARAASEKALRQALQTAQEREREALRAAVLGKQLKELQAKNMLLLELLGERIERVAELEELCQDMRRVFREQLGEACNQLHHTRQVLQAAGLGGQA